MKNSRRRKYLHAALTPILLRNRLSALFKQPFFWFITIWGHSCILVGTAASYHFEHLVNPKLQSWLDTLFWSIATVTTVGYGDAAPMTVEGKVVGIFMMILGSLFLVSYTALFAGALVAPELQAVESEVTELERDIRSADRSSHLDAKAIELLREDIQSLRQELKARDGSQKPPLTGEGGSNPR